MKRRFYQYLLVIMATLVFGSALLTVAYCQDPQCYRLVIISDLHYPCKYIEVNNKQKAAELVVAKKQALQEINTWNDVQEVVFTGDLVAECGSATEYAEVKEFLTGLQLPKTYIPGNHEYIYRDIAADGKLHLGTVATRHQKLNRFQEVLGCENPYFSKRLGTYLLVFLAADRLDTKFATEISPKQLDWLRELLAANRKTPTIVFFHAPLAHTMVEFVTPRLIAQPEQDIEAVLRDNPQVFMWVSGHTHTNPGSPTFNAAVNYYEGRVLDVYNGTWDTLPVCTNSLYLYPDKVLIRTYNHETHKWLTNNDRTVSTPKL